ncbi:hypothetical protein M9H77_17563 [Catharanthus roseus]|uniref:Uncharacterized protein n=1 Tax=Catharanthus roseus TaxID=4058 RepID=A0ACC0B4Z6_CATRO|nr:hypothetical protein M9H77_17563 [Catharanthus roseus]
MDITPIGIKCVFGNFISCAKTFDHIPYKHCCENSAYDVHKGYHDSHDYSDQNCVPCILGYLQQEIPKRFTMFTEVYLPTESHQESTSGPTKMNSNETLRSM